MPKLQRWTGKGTAYKVWHDVNKYVESFTAENPHELEKPWFKTWYTHFHTNQIYNDTLPLQLAAFVITGDPHSTIHNCVLVLFQLIPQLEQHLIIQEVGRHNGNL